MTKKAEIATGLAIVLVSALMSGCVKKQPVDENEAAEQPIAGNEAAEQPIAGNATVGADAEELTWARATVTGDVEGLRAFDQKLKEDLGATDLEANLIRCVKGCDKLSPSEAVPPENLEYYFSREHLSIFVNAWNAGQTVVGDASDFTVYIDAKYIRMDCLKTALKPLCVPIPGCSDGCGKRGPPVNCGYCGPS